MRGVSQGAVINESDVMRILCEWVNMARGRVYTIKAGRICAALGYGADSAWCRLIVKKILTTRLAGCVLTELQVKIGMPVDVYKVREICNSLG